MKLSERLITIFLVVILFAFSAAIIGVGANAVRRRHYELEWRTSFPSGKSRGVQIFDGNQAVRFGVGLMALGAMLGTWGLALSGNMARRGSPQDATPQLYRLGWISLACLLVAIICVFPPWHLRSIPFFAVLAIVGLFVFAVPAIIRKNWGHLFLPCLVGVIIVAGTMDARVGASLLLGIFGSIAILVHLSVLFPRLLGEP